jgi:hypothetical protein
MCCEVFLVPTNILYSVLEIRAIPSVAVVNEFKERPYSCVETGTGSYYCKCSGDLNSLGKIRGQHCWMGLELG